MIRRHPVRILLFLLAAVLAGGAVAPQLKADRYRTRIQAALETALGRKVSIGEIRFNLFTGPGFTVHDVVIEEDPALGAEAIAYVGRMEATPRLWSLLTGHLAFSSLRLDDAHLNLARADLPKGGYRWNLESLLRPAIIAAFPNLTLRGARINFKAGNVKSVVYLLNSNLAIEPPSREGDPWRFRFEGQPARADRSARGSGVVRARGTWKPATLNADFQLERSDLEDVIALLRGEDAGLHGLVSGNAHFSGPLNGIAIQGRLRVEDLHGWDQSVPKGEIWPLSLQGRLNVPGQQLELDAHVEGKRSSPLAVHYLVEQYLTQPRWGASVNFHQFPAAALVPLARHMGAALPAGLELTGTLDGVIGYAAANGFQGQARSEDGRVKLPNLPPLELSAVKVLAEAGHIRLLPVHVTAPLEQEAVIEADYNLAVARTEVRIAARNLRVETLGAQLPWGAVPVLVETAKGRWSGELLYLQTGVQPPMWSGDMQLEQAQLTAPELSEPVLIESAQCRLENGNIIMQKIRASVSGIFFTGDYRYESESARPHKFRLSAGIIPAPALEKLLMPTLRRGREILGVNLPFRRLPIPPWLAGWHAEGTLQAAALSTEAGLLRNLRARFVWDGARIAIPEFAAKLPGSGAVAATIGIDLRNPDPAYDAVAHLSNLEWKSGRLSLESTAQSHGTGAALLHNIDAKGTFRADAILEDIDHLSGRYQFLGHLSLEDLQLVSAGETYAGTGNLRQDGTLLLDLTNGPHPARVSGPLATGTPLKWTVP
ncbi:MAG: AsmA family protein [Acidobacteriota bacterium]|nr:AsmA family protein [Acidobacteriota bacterium]